LACADTPKLSAARVRGVLLVDEIVGQSERWTAATRHRFLDLVREGAIDPAAFDRWLVQDALFVSDLLWFQGRLLARAPRAAQPTLAGGAVAVVDELFWFEQQSALRGLNLAARPLPVTRGYVALLRRLDTAPYEVAVAALWVLERVYLEAWTHAGSAAGLYQEFVEHWTTPQFAAYVAALEALVTKESAPAVAAQIRSACDEVLMHERLFWDAALTG